MGNLLVIKVVYHTQLVSQNGESFAEIARDISEVSVINNPANRITGILAVDVETGKAIQVIEGPKDKVAALYAKIEKDPRHKIDKVLPVAALGRRVYKKSGMMYLGTKHYNMLNMLIPENAEQKYGTQIDFDASLMKDKNKLRELKNVLTAVQNSVALA
jgi:hypothetical protein